MACLHTINTSSLLCVRIRLRGCRGGSHTKASRCVDIVLNVCRFTRMATKKTKPKGSDLVPLNLRMAADLIDALDEIVAERKATDPFTPLTRTDLIREALVRTVTEWRAKKGETP